ncbi:MAG: glycosyltransferase family 39 protein, partial [Phycisphaerae bacterium]|nr:glycosyltransferase family 39 protein [Phycisphaerae bacterium]
MASYKQKASHYLLLAVVLGSAGLVYLLGNDRIALWDRDEPRFSQAGREMTRGEDFIVPYFNDDYRFDKPVLIYWLMVVNNWIFGVGDFAARLGSSISGVLACGLMYLVGRRLFNRQVGLMGA